MIAAFLISPFAPWVLSVSVLILAIAVFIGAGQASGAAGPLLRGGGAIIGGAGVAMLAAAALAQLSYQKSREQFSAPGQYIDLGGYRSHLFCEGPSNGPTIVLISGGYGQGLWLKPLHDQLKSSRRSCMIDRPGVGWADVGPLPRTVDLVMEEIVQTMRRSGEAGPYVFAGHSYGGLYAANIADTYPENTAGIILLDPTPPAWFVEQAATMGCAPEIPPLSRLLQSMFGLRQIKWRNPMYGDQLARHRAVFMQEDWDQLAHWELRPSMYLSRRSAFRQGCINPFGLVRTAGALGDLPLLTIVQSSPENIERHAPDGVSEREMRNWVRWQKYQRTEYKYLSTKAKLAFAPAGATHDFPLFAPEFTLDSIERFMAQLDSDNAQILEGK